MEAEITFNIEKPETAEEIQSFKTFRLELKALLKKGKLKVVEKFRVFSFIIVDYTTEEKNSVAAFLKKESQKAEITSKAL
jgi:hypothetical protein